MLQAIYRSSLFAMLLGAFLCPHSVLAQVAPGVTQSAAQTATVTGTVVRSDGTPVAGADVSLSGPGARLTTASDAHGTFSFASVPYGTYRIDVTTANLGTASRDQLSVRGDITVAIQYSAQSAGGLKTIAHVSTQSAGANINVTPASIASVSPSDYAFAGNASWQHLLNAIPGVAVSGSLGGGSNLLVEVPGNPMQPVILSINGALPYETSVTMDGMPLLNSTSNNGAYGTTPGSGTDLSFLPLPAFETADIVRGPGANAPSIVDSIGGSFVLHAPGRVDQNSFEFSTSTDAYGGILANLKAAVRFGKLSATLVYGINDSPGPVQGNFIPDSTGPILTVNGNAVVNTGQIGYIPNPKFPACYYPVYQDTLLVSSQPYDTAWTQHSGALGLSYDLSPSIIAQVFYAGGSSAMERPGAAQPVDFTPDAGYAGSISPGAQTYFSLTELGPVLKSESLLEEKVTAYIGHGVLRLSALQNNSFYNISFPGIGPPNGQYTLYGTAYYASAPNTPVNFNGTPAQVTFLQESIGIRAWTNNRDLLGSYATQLGTTSHAGVSFVNSYYNAPCIVAGQFDGFPIGSTQSSAVSEQTNELRLNIGTELSDQLSLDASWYVAQGTYHLVNPANPNAWVNSTFPYSAPHLSVVWRANRNTAIRASAGGGYALPPIGYLTGENSSPSCFGVACSQTLSNLNLHPEKSFAFDLGTDIRLQHNTALSFDLYRTNLYGQFFQSTTLTSTCPTCGGLPLYTTQYQNLQQSRFEGITLDLRHDTMRGIYWHAALGLTRGYVVSVPAGFYDGVASLRPTYAPAVCTNCLNTYIIPGINFNGANNTSTGGPVPYANGTLQIGYRWSPQKYVDISPTYYGNNNPYFEPAFVEIDADAGYPLTKNVSLLVTFRNITGIYDQPYQTYLPTMEVPLEGSAGPLTAPFPGAFLGIPYGPRTVTLTANFKY